MFPSLLSGPRCLSAVPPAGPHRGRYEPEGQLFCGRFCWYCTLRCVPFLLSSDPRCSHHGRYGPEGVLRRAVHQSRLHSCRYAEADPMVSQTMEIPQLLDKVVDVPVVQVVWFHRSFISPSWRSGSFHGPDCSSDHKEFPNSLTRWPISLLCGSCRFSGAAVERTVVLPQLQLAEKIVASRKLQLPQLQFFMVVHIPVVAQRQFPMVLRTMAIPPVARG